MSNYEMYILGIADLVELDLEDPGERYAEEEDE